MLGYARLGLVRSVEGEWSNGRGRNKRDYVCGCTCEGCDVFLYCTFRLVNEKGKGRE